MTEIIVLDIGNTIWEEGQDGPWVTKTDLTQLMRCAYRVFLAHRDTVPYEYFMKPELRERLLTGGIDFEKELVTREGIEEEASVEVARSKEGLVRIPALLQNHKLGIRGVLDMVSVENERLIPIEIKSHGQLQASDELELAFYWRLLEPIQKGRRDSHREGYVWLSTGELRKVHLYKSHFEQLDAQIAKVRLIKVEGTQPRMVPECNFCVLRDEHFRIIHSLGDVSLIYDIAGQRSKRLEDLGIQNISDLAAVDVTDLHKKWRQIDRYAPSTKQLKEMQAHAYALLEDKVQVVGEDAIPDMKRAIILDLEYETWPRRQILLVGAIIIEDGKETALHQAFAENISDEKGILAALVNLLKTFPQHKVVTYNGTAADLVEIENAALVNLLKTEVVPKN